MCGCVGVWVWRGLYCASLVQCEMSVHACKKGKKGKGEGLRSRKTTKAQVCKSKKGRAATTATTAAAAAAKIKVEIFPPKFARWLSLN